MIFDIDKMEISEFRKGLQDLQKELNQELKNDPNAAEDVIPLLTSINRLLKELPDVKSPADAKSKAFLQCVPDLAFVMQCLNPSMGHDDEDFDDDFDEDFEDLEDFEVIDNEDDDDKNKKKISRKK